ISTSPINNTNIYLVKLYDRNPKPKQEPKPKSASHTFQNPSLQRLLQIMDELSPKVAMDVENMLKGFLKSGVDENEIKADYLRKELKKQDNYIDEDYFKLIMKSIKHQTEQGITSKEIYDELSRAI